jgi:hypothetical protein
VALKRDAQRTARKDNPEAQGKDRTDARGDRGDHGGEIEAENKDLRLADLFRVPAETKAAVMQIVAETKRRSGWPVYRTLAALGVPRSVFYAWKVRQDRIGPESRAACTNCYPRSALQSVSSR